MTLRQAKDHIAADTIYKRWENIYSEMYGTSEYVEYLEKAAELYASNCKREGFDGGLMAERILNQDKIARLESLLESETEIAEGWLKQCNALKEENDRLKLRRADWPERVTDHPQGDSNEPGRDMSGPPYPIVDFD